MQNRNDHNYSKKIVYTKKTSLLNTDNINLDDIESFIYIEAFLSTKNIKSLTISYKHDNEYISTTINKILLSPFNYSIIDNNDDNHSNIWGRIDNHINVFSESSINHVNNEYLSHYKTNNINIMEGFILGYISYITLFFLFEKTNFKNQLPFNFTIPCSLEDGDCCDFNIMQYMFSPINAIFNIMDDNNVIYQCL